VGFYYFREEEVITVQLEACDVIVDLKCEPPVSFLMSALKFPLFIHAFVYSTKSAKA